MKPASIAVVLSLAVAFIGCKKNEGAVGGASAKDSPVTGKATDAPVPVKPEWKPGNRYVMRLERLQSSLLPGGGGGGRRGQATNNAPVETTYAQEYSVVVTNGADGKRGAELEILGIELSVSRGEQQWLNYDSQNKVAPREPNNPVPDLLDKLVGGRIYYAFDADGKVTKVDGVKELFDRMEPPKVAGGQQRGGAGMVSGMLRRSMTDDVFKQMVDLSGTPREAMKIGDSWPLTREFNAPMIGSLLVSMTNTLRGWQQHEGNKCARIEFTGTITTSKPDQAGAFGGKVSITDAVVKGHTWFDPAIGMAREMQSVQDYKVTASGFGGGRNTNANAGTFTAPIHETTSVKLLEVRPAS